MFVGYYSSPTPTVVSDNFSAPVGATIQVWVACAVGGDGDVPAGNVSYGTVGMVPKAAIAGQKGYLFLYTLVVEDAVNVPIQADMDAADPVIAASMWVSY